MSNYRVNVGTSFENSPLQNDKLGKGKRDLGEVRKGPRGG
jgi:hypothetical protein